MEKYDVVIIGGGLGSLTTATYLSKRLRNVAVFEPGKQKKLSTYGKRFRDAENSNFRFEFYHRDIGGVQRGNLFQEYLKQCGLNNTFEYYDNSHTMIVGKDRQLVRRPNDFNNFRTYLIRHYPKYRDRIHKLFSDAKAHYEDYHLQKTNRLNNREYTLSSALIEWADLSLKDALSKYFDDDNLINEFVLVHDAVGLSANQINAYHYFIKWFDTFIDGARFIATSFDEVVQTLSSEISKTREKIFVDRNIESVALKDNRIDYLVDEKGVRIEAKHYVINMRIDEFVDQFLPDRTDWKAAFYELYPDAESERFSNQVYLGLNCPASDVGLYEPQYLFSDIPDDEIRFLSILDYKAFDVKSCPDGKAALMIEFLDDNSPRQTKLEDVVRQFLSYFPAAKEHITLKRIGTKRPYSSGLARPEYWKGKTINDLFRHDDYSEINPLSNGYFLGSWMKPEAGIAGLLQTGVEYGDIIDDLIYHGDDDDYFITHDELMNIIGHQFLSNALGKQEKNIQFFIGKDSYYIRTKGPHYRLYKGVSDMSDIIIIATNECLYDLSVGNMTLEHAIESGSLEYVGDRAFLEEVMEAFDMGIEITKPTTYRYVQGKWGNKVFLLQMAILLGSNLLANYHYNVIIAFSTLALFATTVYLKYRLLRDVSVFEYVVLGLYGVLGVVSIFVPEVNNLKDAKYTLAFFFGYLLLAWLFNRPLALYYIRHDYRTDYTRTKLFTKMSGGLTFIWAMTFFIILIMDFTVIRSYASLGYYLVPMALYLSIYYPSSYITGYID